MGYPWTTGDTLLAADLNAAIANAGGGRANVLDHGALCDGVTDDTAAVNAALASGAFTVVIPAGKCCFLPNGITVPSGVTLEGGSFFANIQRQTGSPVISPPTSSILTNANLNSVTLGSGGNLRAVALKNLVIRTSATSAPTSGAGVYINTGTQVRCENVMVYNAYDGFYWKTSGPYGITGWMDGCQTEQISGHHVVQDTWPELRLNMCRFTGEYGARAYAYMTGGVSGDLLPNGYFATNCQYNENGPMVGAILLIGGMVSGASGSAQEFQFVNCHMEHFNYAVETDATVLWLMKLKFVGCGIFVQGTAGSSDFFHLNAATTEVTQVQIIGNDIEGPSFTFGNPSHILECQVIGNNIGANVALRGTSGSTLAFLGNGVVGNLALSGTWGALSVDASVRGGTFSDTATGNVTVNVPGNETMVSGPVTLKGVLNLSAFANFAQPAGTNRGMLFQSGASLRWLMVCDNDAESGSNNGSNITLNAYNDAGTVLGTALKIWRASSIVELTYLQINGRIVGPLKADILGNYANDAAAATGGIVTGQFYRNGSVVMQRVT